MKLAEIEAKLERSKCTPELIDQFKTALRRAPKSMRAQHCYTTAVAMPGKCFRQAVELIEYGLELSESWVDQMRSYHNLAILHEKIGDYSKAILCYKFALAAIDLEKRDAYTADYAARMLVCQLHANNFTYSYTLHRFYEQAQELDEFSRSFQKCLFYSALAEIILCRRDGDLPAARDAYKRAKTMLRPDYAGPLTALLKRKHYIESTGATKEARAFLRRCGGTLK